MSEEQPDAGFDGLEAWRLGDAVPAALLDELREAGEVPASWARDDPVLVLSHECDLAHHSLENEPHVEVIRGQFDPSPQERGNASFGKSPRRFAVPVEHHGEQRFAIFNISDVRLVDRERFAGHGPAAALDLAPEQRSRLAEWRGRRYTRRVLPDEFERRLRSAGAPSRIRETVDAHGDRISMLLIAVSPQELPDGQDYDVEVLALVGSEDLDQPQIRTEAQMVVDRIEAELSQCQGIDCQAYLVSESHVSLEDLRAYQHWDFLDHLSRRGSEVAEPPGGR